MMKLNFLLLLFNPSLAAFHTYKNTEKVVAFADAVGPLDNSRETYPLTSLPFCFGKENSIQYTESLGEALSGLEFINLGLNLKFKHDLVNETLCSKSLSQNDIETLQFAVKNSYLYQIYIDDLSVWLNVGEIKRNEKELELLFYTGRYITIGYNSDQIVDLNITATDPISLNNPPTKEVAFSYSVQWVKSDILYKDRFQKYLDAGFFEHEIHWYSILYSFIMVVVLIALATLVMFKTISKDLHRYGSFSYEDSKLIDIVFISNLGTRSRR